MIITSAAPRASFNRKPSAAPGPQPQDTVELTGHRRAELAFNGAAIGLASGAAISVGALIGPALQTPPAYAAPAALAICATTTALCAIGGAFGQDYFGDLSKFLAGRPKPHPEGPSEIHLKPGQSLTIHLDRG